MPTVYFEDLEVGSVHLGRECVCDKDEMLEFSRRNDPWPFHVDGAAAALSPYGGIVASGGYIVTFWDPLSSGSTTIPKRPERENGVEGKRVELGGRRIH